MDAIYVLRSAVPHPHELHLGAYSVHTSENALAAGKRNIRELKQRLDAAGGSTHGIRFDACAPRMSLASTIVERLRLKPCSAHVDDVLNRDEGPA